MLIRDPRILTVVKVEAYCRRGEELHEVLKTDEKDAVFLILTIYLFTRMHGPLGRLVAPSTLPFDAAVRVPNLDESFRL